MTTHSKYYYIWLLNKLNIHCKDTTLSQNSSDTITLSPQFTTNKLMNNEFIIRTDAKISESWNIFGQVCTKKGAYVIYFCMYDLQGIIYIQAWSYWYFLVLLLCQNTCVKLIKKTTKYRCYCIQIYFP